MKYQAALDILRNQRHYFTARGQFLVEEKSRANYVTEIDKKIEETIKASLQHEYPDINFVGEEELENKVYENYWLLDPIDGTQNYIKGQYPSMISLALVIKKEVVFAVIYDPYFDEMYYANKGEGAYLNDKKLHVSNGQLKKAIIMLGTSPYNRELSPTTFKLAKVLFDNASDIRRSGSACYDLVQVATGRAEAYLELHVHSWDYAAGYLLIKEAGGQLSDIRGRSLDKMMVGTTSIVASNGHIHHDLLTLLEHQL